MMDALVEKVNKWADEEKVLQPETMLIAGVSGGADSVCLLHVLRQLKESRAFSITAVHINHMLRGEEAYGDESFVIGLCNALDVPLKVFREDVKTLSRKKGLSFEETGRLVRYERFEQVLSETGAKHIAVAHHAHDQAETIFMNLLRGSGLDGLCGMKKVQGKIIRPFLTTGKNEIYDYIDRNGLSYRIDRTNLDNSYARNMVRNSIFPNIKQQTGISIETSLLRASRVLETDRDYLNQEALQHYANILISEEKETIVLNRLLFSDLHDAMAARVLRIAWEKLLGSTKGLEAKHVEAALKLARKKGSGKSVNLPCCVLLETEYEHLSMSRRPKNVTEPFNTVVHIPCTEEPINEKLKITARVYTKDEYVKAFGSITKNEERSPLQLFDYNRLNGEINIRTRLPGDVFYPYGSPGNKKLKEFFIDEKIPKSKRDETPLLADQKKILWVIGARTAEDYKTSDNTESILLIKITGMEDNNEDKGFSHQGTVRGEDRRACQGN